MPTLMRRSKYNKALYMDLMALLFRLLSKSRQQGMLSLEFDIDNPQESEIFSNYPRILADNHLVEFITDYLRLMVSRQYERV
ncbi:Chemotaxis protein MotA [Serratia rubidaea]|uniref:Chemotaxis protein MotA n=1 Tax=Serratia rubidaea TaxID=61652 RepID=A0A4V6JHG7_SERRU|nr:Chemotaxis protein MotA [Serratia rubidaea]